MIKMIKITHKSRLQVADAVLPKSREATATTPLATLAAASHCMGRHVGAGPDHWVCAHVTVAVPTRV